MKAACCALFIIVAFLIATNRIHFNIENIFTSKSHENIEFSKLTMINTNKIFSPYERFDIKSMPSELQLTDEENEYLADLIISLSNIISEKSTLETEEKAILGPGEYFWPKDPSAPTHLIKVYKPTNFRMSGLTLTVRRESTTSIWNTIGLSIQPRNFPHGVFLTNLPDKTFEDYSLKKVVDEYFPDEQVEKPTVYYFKHKSKNTISMKIRSPYEASKNMVFPKKFYAIVFSRESEPVVAPIK